jgi:hypothetical protein
MTDTDDWINEDKDDFLGMPRVDIDEDNLRGFDPASEDDSHDNGMRRYMENDDEEGWY